MPFHGLLDCMIVPVIGTVRPLASVETYATRVDLLNVQSTNGRPSANVVGSDLMISPGVPSMNSGREE